MSATLKGLPKVAGEVPATLRNYLAKEFPMDLKRENYLAKAKTRLLAKKLEMQNGCWYYTGSLDKGGYGQITFDKANWKVHRLAMLLFKPEEFDETKLVCHTCNHEKCFNPEHLYSGTYSNNAQDKLKAGHDYHASMVFCKRGHEFTPENTYLRPTGGRACRICGRDFAALKRLLQ